MVTLPIKLDDWFYFPKIKAQFLALPIEVRRCLDCEIEVKIRETDFLPNPGPARPFAAANCIGCCDAAINRIKVEIGRDWCRTVGWL